MTNHPRQNWMNHCNHIWLRPTLSSMPTAHKAKKPIVHFRCERSKEICFCFVLLLVTHIDLFTHSADMFGSRPFKSFVQSFDSWYSDKKACRPLQRIHSQHKPPGTIHPPILHIGILDSLRKRSRDQIDDLYYHRVPVPFWDRHPGSGPYPHQTKFLLGWALAS